MRLAASQSRVPGPCVCVCVCFHSTSVGVDHVSKRFTGGLQGSGSTERWRKGRPGSSTSEALMAPNGAIPASERTLQRPPYRAARPAVSPRSSAASTSSPLALSSRQLSLLFPLSASVPFDVPRLLVDIKFTTNTNNPSDFTGVGGANVAQFELSSACDSK